MVVQEEIDVGFCTDNLLLESVTKFFRKSRRLGRLIGKFFDDFSYARVNTASDQTHRPNTHFTGTISTKDRAILNECDAAAHASR